MSGVTRRKKKKLKKSPVSHGSACVETPLFVSRVFLSDALLRWKETGSSASINHAAFDASRRRLHKRDPARIQGRRLIGSVGSVTLCHSGRWLSRRPLCWWRSTGKFGKSPLSRAGERENERRGTRKEKKNKRLAPFATSFSFVTSSTRNNGKRHSFRWQIASCP